MNHTTIDIEDSDKVVASLANPQPKSFKKTDDPTRGYNKLSQIEQNKLRKLIEHLAYLEIVNDHQLAKEIRKMSKMLGMPNKGKLGFMYNKILEEVDNKIPYNEKLHRLLVMRKGRSQSGIVSITQVLGPQVSRQIISLNGENKNICCDWDCVGCPSQPGMPKSYHSDEPAIARAVEVDFDPRKQFDSRCTTLKHNNHTIDKAEIIVLGGTLVNNWFHLIEEFMRDTFYAANTFKKTGLDRERPRLSLSEEQKINQNSVGDKNIVHIIGVSFETRPDTITNPQLIIKEIERNPIVFYDKSTLDLVKLAKSFPSKKVPKNVVDQLQGIMLNWFRKLGGTRMQIGAQSDNDDILKKFKRGHDAKATSDATQLLLDYGWKVDTHYMQDMIGSSPEIDKRMFLHVLQSIVLPKELTEKQKIVFDLDFVIKHRYSLQDALSKLEIHYKIDTTFRSDYAKFYPQLDVAYTRLGELKRKGIWKPYAEEGNGEKLLDVLLYGSVLVPKSVRVNRIQRDFCLASESNGYVGYESKNIKGNLAQIIHEELDKLEAPCQCIRCREVMGGKIDSQNMKFMIDSFPSGNAIEYYISCEKPQPKRNKLYGFIRLRLSKTTQNSQFPELKGNTALIRELHVYGQVQKRNLGEDIKNTKVPQHLGIGKRLLEMAEHIAIENKFDKIAVISGIGVREYYKKNGYHLIGTYMVKNFKKINYIYNYAYIVLLLSILVFYKLLFRQ